MRPGDRCGAERRVGRRRGSADELLGEHRTRPDAGEHADRRVVEPRQAAIRARRVRRAATGAPSRTRQVVGVADDAGDPHLRAAARDDQRRHAGAVARDRHRGDLRRPGPGVGHRDCRPCGREHRDLRTAVRAGTLQMYAERVDALGSTSPARASITADAALGGHPGDRAVRPAAPPRSRDRARPGSPRATRAPSPPTARGPGELVAGEEAEAVLREHERGPGDARRARRHRLGGERRRRDRHLRPGDPGGREARLELGLHAVEGRRIRPAAPRLAERRPGDARLQRHRRASQRHALGEGVAHRVREPVARRPVHERVRRSRVAAFVRGEPAHVRARGTARSGRST